MIRIRARAGRTRRTPGEMNKTEQAYSMYLAEQQLIGAIQEFRFESIKLKLAPNTFYSPDFMVVSKANEVEFHEVKGGKRRKDGTYTFWAEEDSTIKIKLAASLFPFRFVRAFQAGKGQWQQEEVGA